MAASCLLLNLPLEVILETLRRFGPHELLRVELVCKTFRRLAYMVHSARYGSEVDHRICGDRHELFIEQLRHDESWDELNEAKKTFRAG